MKGVGWRLQAQELCIAIVLASCCLLHLLLLLLLLPLITQHVQTIHNHPRGSLERGANADQQKLISTTVALGVQDQVEAGVVVGAGAGAVEIMQRSNNGSRNNNTTPGLCHFCYSFERFPLSIPLSLLFLGYHTQN